MLFEDDETLRLYIEESRDNLATIENDLLEIEAVGVDIDEERINNVFRAAHSIKGGAGFMGLSNIKELSHKLEGVLGMIRNREIVPTQETISTLLKAFDTLREMINDVENSIDLDISDHVTALIRLTTSCLPEDEKNSISKELDISLADGRKIFTVPQFDMDQARKENLFIYVVEYDLIHDIQRKNRTPLDVLATLMSGGTIIQSKIDIEAVGTLEEQEVPARIPFYVLFASIMEFEVVIGLFDVGEKYIHLITQDMVSVPSHAPSSGLAAHVPVPGSAEIKDPLPEIAHPEVMPEPVESEARKDAPFESKSQPGSPLVADTVQQPKNFQKIQSQKTPVTQTSLRVNVNLLDSLMTLAGELVLSRNQLVQGVLASNMRGLEAAGQRIDMVTSELQEAIMRTRMQPIAIVFDRFPRVVRDLAQELGKKVHLVIEGKNVELDKTIIEAISDPLTHLIRNSVDHGIESPDTRNRLNKDPVGKVKLSAFHEAGQVNIEISDNGRGLDSKKLVDSAVQLGLITEQQAGFMSEKEKLALIFLPGFSTVDQITDISGRGVGMDVVKTNLDKLGGVVDIDSKVGEGTVIRIKLPLTLAIIPSQIISVGNERYAIPQVNLNELLRIPASQIKERIEKVGDAEVVRLRGNLLPLLNLATVMAIDRTYVDSGDGREHPERRMHLADRRSRKSFISNGRDSDGTAGFKLEDEGVNENVRPGEPERRVSTDSAINIAVVTAGPFKYGLVVDQLWDSEEIVVKPLGRHLKSCEGYAGATIMGDGKVALILDVAGLAHMAKLTSLKGAERVSDAAREVVLEQEASKDMASFLLFRNSENEQCAVPLCLVERVERIKVDSIENLGGKKVIQYRGGSLPLFSLDEVARVKPLPQTQQLEVIVFKLSGKEVGLLVTPPVDAVDIAIDVDMITLKQPGIMGSAIIGGCTTLMVDIFEIARAVNPGWFDEKKVEPEVRESRPTILFAEDSDFFRIQVKEFLEDENYNVMEASDGKVAWELLVQHPGEIDLIVTDLEMPNMNGFELASLVKEDERFSHLPIIALTSLAGDDDIARGRQMGITDYQIKLDRDRLIASANKYLKK